MQGADDDRLPEPHDAADQPPRPLRPEGDPPAGPRSGPGHDDPPAGDAGMAPGGGHDSLAPRPPVPITQQVGRVTLVVLVVLFVIFAAANSHPVDFSWVFGTTSVEEAPGGGTTGGVPLIVLLVSALVTGIAIGALVEWQLLRARRARSAQRRA